MSGAEEQLMEVMFVRLDKLEEADVRLREVIDANDTAVHTKLDKLIDNTGADRTNIALVKQKVGMFATVITLVTNAIVFVGAWIMERFGG